MWLFTIVPTNLSIDHLLMTWGKLERNSSLVGAYECLGRLTDIPCANNMLQVGFWRIPTKRRFSDGMVIISSNGKYTHWIPGRNFYRKIIISQIKSAMWLLYLDDNVILWPQRKDIQTMLDHVNSTRPSIQFTI